MDRTPKAYLLSGRTGAGKTTLAKQMESDFPAYRISHDEYLFLAYGRKIPPERFEECCERINRLVWRQVESLAKLHIDIIIEGWGTRKRRDEARLQLDRIGMEYRFIFVDCPRSIRWERVRERNRNPGDEGYRITEDDFNRMERIKEEFDEDEEGVLIDGSQPMRLADALSVDRLPSAHR